MTRSFIILILICIFCSKICKGQNIVLDSCGLDSSNVLNQQEIIFLKNIFFADKIFATEKEFEYHAKNIAFYNCDNNQFLSKNNFFIIAKSGYQGSKGLFVLNERQRELSGLDCIIVITCKWYNPDKLIKIYNKKSI